MEKNFGTSTPYSLGIEEEFQLVDPDTLGLVSRVEPILESIAGETIRERVEPELLQSMLEISTRIAVTVEEAVDEVVDLRSHLARIAADHGVALAASGTHPFSRCDAQTNVSNVAAIAALVQSLAATIGSAFECGDVVAPGSAIVLEENRRRAARDGLAARLIDLGDETEQPASDAVQALAMRCVPAADALGCLEELELVEQILDCGNGADEQLRVYDDTADVRAVAGALVERTAAQHASLVF